jgi:hypothetical protein
MIKPSKDGTKLWFLPPEKSNEQELEFPLVYAHVCPKCNNLVQALFMTDKKIDPKPWEEIFTKILDAQGHFKRIIPGRHDRFRSRYTVHTIGRGSSVSAELIRFTEHFDRREDPNNQPVCGFVTISSVIPEYRVYDILLVQNMDPARYNIKDEHWEAIKEKLLHSYSGVDQYSFVPAIGNGPECVMMSRTAYNWYMNEAVGKYFKPYTPPVQQHTW